MRVADRFPTAPDPLTGAPVIELTAGATVHHHLDYRTASFTPDGRFLAYVSHETGWPNLCLLELATGEVRRLTARRDLFPFSAVVSRDGLAVLYAAQDRLLGAGVPDGEESELGRFPGARLGALAASPDGRAVAVPLALAGGWRLVEVDLFTGATRVLADEPSPLAGVSYSPDGAWLLGLEEPGSPVAGSGRGGIRLITRDGSGGRLLIPPREGEWLAHPVWIDAGTVGFVKLHDGLYVTGLNGSPRCVFKGPIWHAAPSPAADLLVCDTIAPDLGVLLVAPRTGVWRTLCHPHSSNRGTRWTEPLPAPGSLDDPALAPLPGEPPDPAETRYGPAWTHPRPSFAPGGEAVVLTSDATGWARVRLVRIPPGWREALVGPG